MNRLIVWISVLALLASGCSGPSRRPEQSAWIRDALHPKPRKIRIETGAPATVTLYVIGQPDMVLGSAPVEAEIPPRAYPPNVGAKIQFVGSREPLDINPFDFDELISSTGQVRIPAPNYGDPPELDVAEAAIKANLETRLIDPTSPLFEWGSFSKQAAVVPGIGLRYAWVLKFLLNSKNRMGGYAGWITGYAWFYQRELMTVEIPDAY